MLQQYEVYIAQISDKYDMQASIDRSVLKLHANLSKKGK